MAVSPSRGLVAAVSIGLGCALFTAWPGTTSAATVTTAPARAAAVQAISDCRKVADKDARLTCYDKAADSFDQAQAQGQLVVVDREQVRTVRRQSFGFNIPSISIFSRNAPKEEPIDKVTVELASVHQAVDGRWVMVTTDDAVWRQTDTDPFGAEPRQGSKMAIRKGLLGSFFCKVNGQTAIRCARDR